MAFQTKVRHARFVVGPFSSTQMATLGDILRDTMRDRIQNGINANDSPAKQLSPGYAAAKQRKGLNPFRDWTNSGNTVRAMVTLSADENKATIGFNNPV